MLENPPCQLYLISPQDVGGDFPLALEAALSAGPVAAFQFRVKDIDQHEAARLAEPLQEICAAHDVAIDEETLWAEAIEWQATRGSRSGRVAWQYFTDLAGRRGVNL